MDNSKMNEKIEIFQNFLEDSDVEIDRLNKLKKKKKISDSERNYHIKNIDFYKKMRKSAISAMKINEDIMAEKQQIIKGQQYKRNSL
jgi:hypothetical protein